MKKIGKKEMQAENTYLHEGTLRSGQRIKHSGNVVILGDLNPGSEVIADGHVVVFGNLRGLVHAGAAGDTEAYIMAYHLNPLQVRIADLIGRAPDDMVRQNEEIQEIAEIKDGSIVVKKYNENQ